MADIASLGIVVRTDGVQQAEKQLDSLTKAGSTAERQAQRIAPAMDKAAISAKQLAQATRGLPAQFTDIATSLASGANPLQVFLQQGGQIKDQFGGAGNALRAVGGYVRGLINPFTVAAAAAVGLAIAYQKGSDEAVEFNKALILTGNYAGTTADRLGDLAAQMDALPGVTRGSAAAALAQVAATGRFTSEQLEAVATAAENMRVGTGRAIEDTIKDFVRLREDPLNAVLALNDTYHFLTQSTYDQIKALKEQGREVDAATVAIQAYAGAINQRIPQVEENLGYLEKAWRGIKNAAREAWDAMLAVGRKATINEQLADLHERRAALAREYAQIKARQPGTLEGSTRSDFLRLYEREFKELEAQYKALEKQAQSSRASARRATGANSEAVVDSSSIRERQRAQEEFDRIALSNLDKRQRLEREIAEIREKGRKAGVKEAEIERQVAAARARYAESLPKGRKTVDPTVSLLASIRQQIALNEEQAKAEDTLTASQRLRVRVMQELDALGSKLTAGRRAEIEAALQQLAATDAVVQKQQEEKRLKEDLLRLTNQLAQAEVNRARANEIDLLSIGRGREAIEQMRRRLEIEREYEDGLRALRDRGIAQDSESYREQEKLLRASRDRMLAEEAEFQRKRQALMQDWRNGARAATEDYIEQNRNVAAQVYDIWTNAFRGAEDVLVEFLTKGKADWKGFFDSIAADITRFVVRQQLTKLAEKFLPGLGGGDDQAAGLSKAAGELAASAVPLLGAASALSAAAAALAAAGAANGAMNATTAAAGGQPGGGWWSALVSAFSGGWGGIAMGGAFGYGQRLDKFALGGVVNSPTLFQHGSRIGLMGEAGPEAIVPLYRGRDGKLGVKMAQPIAAPGPVALSQTFVIEGRLDSSTQEQLARRAGREAARGLARTGR